MLSVLLLPVRAGATEKQCLAGVILSMRDVFEKITVLGAALVRTMESTFRTEQIHVLTNSTLVLPFLSVLSLVQW